MAVPTITLVLRQKDITKAGSLNPKFRLLYKRQSKLIASKIRLYKGDYAEDRTNPGQYKIKAVDYADALNDSLKEIRQVLNTFIIIPETWTVDDLWEAVQKRLGNQGGFTLDFFEYAEKVFKRFPKKPSTEAYYRSAINNLKRYLDGAPFNMTDITASWLYDFSGWLEAQPKHNVFTSNTSKKIAGKATVVNVKSLKYFWSKAAKEFPEHFTVNPFDGFEMPKVVTPEHRDIGPDMIQRVIDDRLRYPSGSQTRMALDLFVFSFALHGMNAADLYSALPPRPAKYLLRQPDGTRAEEEVLELTYYRQKTRDKRSDKAEHHVLIETCVKSIYDIYKDPDGKRFLNMYKRYKTLDTFNSALRKGLARYFQDTGIEKFDFYSGRHTWGTVGFNDAGLDIFTIGEGLIHKDVNAKVTNIYVRKDWRILWEANRQILALFDWSSMKGEVAGEDGVQDA